MHTYVCRLQELLLGTIKYVHAKSSNHSFAFTSRSSQLCVECVDNEDFHSSCIRMLLLFIS